MTRLREFFVSFVNRIRRLPGKAWQLISTSAARIRQNWAYVFMLLVILAVLAFVANAVWGTYTQGPQGWEWTGFGDFLQPDDNNYERAKTLWDWMELILAPLTLFGIAFLFTQWTQVRERRREIYEADQEKIARQERYREEALQAYFNSMATLMLDHELLTDEPMEKQVAAHNIAQLRTVTLLRRMTDEDGTDQKRIDEILDFLRDSRLLAGPRGVLAGATMTGIELSGVNLWKANLEGAELFRANLSNTSLVEANLTEANLSESDLHNTLLVITNLTGANLSDANLRQADLIQAILYGANLKWANLLEANLSEAKFNDFTILPNNAAWTTNTDWAMFTNPSHVHFWKRPPGSPQHYSDEESHHN